MIIYFSVILIFLKISFLSCQVNQEHGYYWREFYGNVPNDAFLAGFDQKGPIYVGQVLYEGKLIPGKLYENDKFLYFEYNERVYKRSQDIKILCSKYTEDLEWVKTESSNYDLYNLVNGGHQEGFFTYVGLAIENSEANVGKVICEGSRCLAMYAEKDGENVEYHSYYVLTYNPDSNNGVEYL